MIYGRKSYNISHKNVIKFDILTRGRSDRGGICIEINSDSTRGRHLWYSQIQNFRFL